MLWITCALDQSESISQTWEAPPVFDKLSGVFSQTELPSTGFRVSSCGNFTNADITISIRFEPRLPWYGNKLQTGPRVNQLSALLIYHGLWVDLKLYTSRFTVLKKLSNVSITHLNTKYSVFLYVFIERTETPNCYFCQLTCISQRPLQSTLFLSVKTSKINSSYAKVAISVCSNFKISMYLFFIIEKVKRTLFNSYLMK